MKTQLSPQLDMASVVPSSEGMPVAESGINASTPAGTQHDVSNRPDEIIDLNGDATSKSFVSSFLEPEQPILQEDDDDVIDAGRVQSGSSSQAQERRNSLPRTEDGDTGNTVSVLWVYLSFLCSADAHQSKLMY